MQHTNTVITCFGAQGFIILIRTCECVTEKDILQLRMSSSLPCSILLPGTVSSLPPLFPPLFSPFFFFSFFFS